MKYLPQFPFFLAIYCFCLLQHPSSGYIQALDDSPDGVDTVQLERLAYWATLSSQPKDIRDIYKRFLFDYSRAQETTQPVNTGFPPGRPSVRLAASLAEGKMRRFLQRDSGAVAPDFTKKDHAATRGRPFFLFRPRNGRNTEHPVG
uniref:Neuromedin-S n=2 Tax=Pipistrellus kuhlii TaxID=59472 RepID=A0A7J7VVM6_PIPKU|nr:neuromedin-S [Pipistrellus kuhlii]KAF6329133.1 neuromedin S [Pipistrellus kuhlii]